MTDDNSNSTVLRDMVIKAIRSTKEENDSLRADAERFRWLRDNAREELLNPQAAASELAPDMRTQWVLPTLICSGPVGGYLTFEQAVDIKRGANNV